MAKAKINVYLKNGILDPQGQAIHNILKTMDMKQVERVRVGKIITLDFSSQLSEKQVTQQSEEICKKILANPIIEDFKIEVFLD
ncbi:phosphoribosylformylglycinamidine synthase subunit PurS [candidate division KSB1 bacterium]|nr:phosphoribosylformylglycinamidine synthase subunit PurS [candidate division KSB1 bacterium]